MAYIANRSIRFDKDYAIGEIIPESVIDPLMIQKLIDSGRIIRTDISEGKDAANIIQNESSQNDSEGVSEGEKGADDINGHADTLDTSEGVSDNAEGEDEGGEYICGTCGKAFKTKNALSAHAKSHK